VDSAIAGPPSAVGSNATARLNVRPVTRLLPVAMTRALESGTPTAPSWGCAAKYRIALPSGRDSTGWRGAMTAMS
jgi:hypothetical protein